MYSHMEAVVAFFVVKPFLGGHDLEPSHGFLTKIGGFVSSQPPEPL